MSAISTLSAKTSNMGKLEEDDFDPLVDLEVTVEIKKIRSFDKLDQQIPSIEFIDLTSDPDFYVKVFINDDEFVSDVWPDTKYLYDIDWKATSNVPDNIEFVDIKIELWDQDSPNDKKCDISKNGLDVQLQYSLKTGHWTGDDERSDDDISGYGRLNGCDDGSIYKRGKDCELWFNIYQNDYDGDYIPYWTEINNYGTDPEINNAGEDMDNDDIPIEWEWKWGYDPNIWNDHKRIDPENDGINNYEEFLTSQWDSDPYIRDLFIELDQMNGGPSGESESILPEGSRELLYTAYDRQNVIYHLDDGKWDETGSEMIPFDSSTNEGELYYIYNKYFLQSGSSWRRGVFHYGLVIYQCSFVNGHCFRQNSFQISSNAMEKKAAIPTLNRDVVYASAYMHETGHTLGFWPIPGHDPWSGYPWQLGFWINRPYKSCMNYGYMYRTVDYSDGSRPLIDYDDWTRMDLTHFQREW
jgi:hypothetical protein